ncbi:MAG TPA: glycosyltransferase [Ktedonobacteraceae bacterium]|nr:glycosyltransferase [Ktedonobacteraceae bacterium]
MKNFLQKTESASEEQQQISPVALTLEEQPPFVSIIIPVWNRCEDLKDTLQQLQRQTYAFYEVMVIDDASIEPIEEMVCQYYPSVRFFRLQQNSGAGVARNVGMREAKGELVLFLDSDTVPEDQALEKFVRKFLAEPDLGIASGLQYDASTGKPWWWWTQHGYDEEHYLHREFETAFKFAEGAAAARKDVILAVDGYPEDFFMAGEGRDLAARVTDAGYRVMFWPEVTFQHKGDSAQRLRTNDWYRSIGSRLYLEFRNEFWYTVKYFPISLLVVKTTLNLARNFRTAMQFHALGAFFRAYRDALRGLPAQLKHRKVLKSTTIFKITGEKYKKLLGPLMPGRKEALADAAKVRLK